MKQHWAVGKGATTGSNDTGILIYQERSVEKPNAVGQNFSWKAVLVPFHIDPPPFWPLQADSCPFDEETPSRNRWVQEVWAG